MKPVKQAAPRVTRTQRGIQSVEVGGRLLDALARARTPLALSDLAASAALAPGQAHAYVVSLARLGLIKRDEISGRYEPGPLSLRLGLLHLERQPAFRAAVPRVAVLAEVLGFSIAICIAGPQGPTIVRYEHAGFPLHVNLHVGTVMSLPATSTGRVFCAHLPTSELHAMWANQAGTPGSSRAAPPLVPASERAAFDATLATIRTRGIERGIDAPSPGISSLSVPVCDATGRMLLALTAIGTTGSIDVAWQGPVARALRDTARAIGADLAVEEISAEAMP
ncbi:IclR family transcriptional regulator [Paraburkholderia sp.]|uniref:IclR family transcriptional regulator n=1 Tax=Paraburkholderia sp. TaxID=1926495 RepID=UPI003D6DE097